MSRELLITSSLVDGWGSEIVDEFTNFYLTVRDGQIIDLINPSNYVNIIGTGISTSGIEIVNTTRSGSGIEVPSAAFNVTSLESSTVEFWVYFTNPIAELYDQMLGQWGSGANSTFQFCVLDSYLAIAQARPGNSISTFRRIPNTWMHVAYVNPAGGGNMVIYVNGVSEQLDRRWTVSPNLNIPMSLLKVYGQNGFSLLGRIAKMRISTIARYTENFVPNYGMY
ncbi:MAG: LamG domain-containing protein [Gammaproteobacteria bacterium]|nr:LamG domain-containing protein [Acholeplasmataceae bacterium]MCK9529101.1 LamG domain-containing protein [Gammaproteobacteria bacterium]